MTTLPHVRTRPFAKRLRRVAQLRRTRGNARTVYAILRRLVDLPILRHCVHLCAVDFWRLPIPDSWSRPHVPSLFSIRLAHADDRAELARYFGDHERVEDRFARGDQCVVAICQKAIGAAVWIAVGPSHSAEDWQDLRCALHFPAGVVFTYDGKGTKMGAWGTMMKQLPRFLLDQNVQEITTIIDSDNWQSIDAHRSLGYTPEGLLLHIRVFGITMRFFKPPQHGWQRVPHTINRVHVSQKRPARQRPTQSNNGRAPS